MLSEVVLQQKITTAFTKRQGRGENGIGRLRWYGVPIVVAEPHKPPRTMAPPSMTID